MTVAELGIKVTSDADRATRELNSLTAASSKAEAAAQELSGKTTQAATAAKSLANSAEIEARALNVSAAAARTAANSNQQLVRSMEQTKFATANVAAQLNDIGVQLASGTSPFLVAIQQGTQLNQVFGQSGLRGAVGMLGGAFMSLINPVSLATIGIVGLGGYAVQYFYDMVSGSEKSAEALEKEAKLIQSVADKWGEATPALKAYADERQKLADMADLKSVMGTAAAEQFAAVTAEVDNLKISVADVASSLRIAGAESSQINGLQDAFADLQKAVADSTATSEDAKAVQTALMGLYINTGIPAVGDLAAQFYSLAGAIAAASGEADKFKIAQQGGALTNWQGRTSQLSPLGQVGPVYSAGGKFINEDELQTIRANATQSKYMIEQEKAARSAGRALRQAAEDAIDPWEGMRKVSEGVKEQMRDLARQAKETARFWSGTAKGFVDDFTSGLEQGKSAWASFADAGVNALKRIADKLLDQAFEGLFGGNSGGLFGGLFGGGGGGLNVFPGGGSVNWFGGLWAKGGAFPNGISGHSNTVVNRPTPFMFAKGAGIMGEAGPEGILPLRRNSQGQLGVIASGAANNNQPANYNDNRVYHIDARGAQQGVGVEIQKALAAYDRQLPNRVQQISNDPRAR